MTTEKTCSHINYESDFSFLLSLSDKDGNPVGFPSCDWRLAIYSKSGFGRKYFASCVGGVATNCIAEGEGMRIVCDSHRIGKGELEGKLYANWPDAIYADGHRLAVEPFPLGITLVDGPADDAGEIRVEASLPMAIVTAYELAVKQGYQGSQAEFYAALTTLPGLAAEVQSREDEWNDAETAREQAEQARRSAETSRTDAEAAREQAETQRGLAETARSESEQARAEAETQRASSELTRQSQEQARQSRESGRQSAEQVRESAEAQRASAESARAEAETKREQAEQDRAAAEAQRDQAEQSRASAEQSRSQSEEQRKSAEQSREQAETQRIGDEQSRASAEQARAKAETARQSAETARASAETQRASAETARQSAETARQSAEQSRAAAETQRGQAETARETEFATLKSESQSATNAANAAAESAQQAIDDLQQEIASVDAIAEEAARNTHDIDAAASEPRYDGEMPTLCGQPTVLFGSGAPVEANVPYNWNQFDAEGEPGGSIEDGTAAAGFNWNGSPAALGQQYYDVSGTSAVHYIAARQTFDPDDVNYHTFIWKQC